MEEDESDAAWMELLADGDEGGDADGVAPEAAEPLEAEVERAVAEEDAVVEEEAEEDAAVEEEAAEEATDVMVTVTEEEAIVEAEGEMQVEPLTGYIEIEDGGEEEDYDYDVEQMEGAQQAEEVEDPELADLEAAAVEQAEGECETQAGAEFRDALEELPEGDSVKPKARVQATPKASARSSATKADNDTSTHATGQPTSVASSDVSGAKAVSSGAPTRPEQLQRKPNESAIPLLAVARKGKSDGKTKGPRPAAVVWRPAAANAGKGSKMQGVASAAAPWNRAAELRGRFPGANGAAKGATKGMAKGTTKGLAKGAAKGVSKGISKGVVNGAAKGVVKGASKGATKGVAKGVTKGVTKGKLASSDMAAAPWNSSGRTSLPAAGGRPPATAATTTASTTSASKSAAESSTTKASKVEGKDAAAATSTPLSVSEKIKASIKAAKIKAAAGGSEATGKKEEQSLSVSVAKKKNAGSSSSDVAKKIAEAVASANKRKGGNDAAEPAAPWKAGPASKKPKIQQVAAKDAEGRQYDLEHVVVNMANVGAYFATKVLKTKTTGPDRCLFDWEGVRRCCRHLTSELGLKVIGVLFENFNAPDNGSLGKRTMPDDIRRMCVQIQETPRIQGQNHSSADDEMTIKCAYRRNCRFMDNDNYRDWKSQLRDEKVRLWLGTCQDLLQMRYYFDNVLGTFDTLDGNTPPGLLAPVQGVKRTVSKQELWTASRA